MAPCGPVDEDDVMEEADVFHLAEPTHVHVDELAQELVVVAEAVGAFAIKHLEDQIEGGRGQLGGHGPAQGGADAHRREQRRHFAAPASQGGGGCVDLCYRLRNCLIRLLTRVTGCQTTIGSMRNIRKNAFLHTQRIT